MSDDESNAIEPTTATESPIAPSARLDALARHADDAWRRLDRAERTAALTHLRALEHHVLGACH